jgi:hypothetical protein
MKVLISRQLRLNIYVDFVKCAVDLLRIYPSHFFHFIMKKCNIFVTDNTHRNPD